ncbi:hypothetical protein GRX03_08145 [Halovenus sp. WSH3]|uniref:GLUG domain protein n=1 Tax=Halovenus carboxidivorans TaxID=2692199 RepID=A0A6B0T7K1_9EURY|nr:hypothetical protein [Halovenus carboxidivorans]MXR51573.1 hypothetical protein [Halovenus carboxidivorans]
MPPQNPVRRQSVRAGLAVVALVCAVALVASAPALAQETSDESVELAGNGTAESPYEVSNLSELRAIENDLGAHYVLTDDIDGEATRTGERVSLGNARRWDNGRPFTGVLDGQGHTIRHDVGPLFHTNDGTIRQLRVERVAIVGAYRERMIPGRPQGVVAAANTGNITNVVVANASVTEGRFAGSIVGVNRGGRITDSRVTGTTVQGGIVGGIVGRTVGGTVEATAVDGAVSGRSAGGVAGESNETTIRETRSSATVSGDERLGRAGGLVGDATATRIEDSLVTGEADGSVAGAILGRTGNETTVEATYWAQTAGRQGAANGSVAATAVPTAQLTGATARRTLPFRFPEQWLVTDSYPVPSGVIGNGTLSTLGGETVVGAGTESNPYVITTVEQLQAMNADLDGHYVLGSDIDASATAGWGGPDERGWVPIGGQDLADVGRLADSEVFTGTFDGRNHTIRGLTIDRPDPGYMGLFGVNRGTIENVELRHTDISTYYGRTAVFVMPGGILVGANQGRISAVTVTDGAISNDVATGIIGRHDDGAVSDITVRNVTIRTNAATGGVVGIQSGGIVERVNVTGLTTDPWFGTVGGIVGELTNGTVRTAAVSGTVSGGTVGGIVGEADNGTVTQVRSTARVDGEDAAGGLVGNATETTVSEGYAAGPVTLQTPPSRSPPDGIAGGVLATDDNSTIARVYWDRKRTGRASAVGRGPGTAVALSTPEMLGYRAANSMTGLDFQDVWTITDSYPAVRAIDNPPVRDVRVLNVTLSKRAVTLGEEMGVRFTVENPADEPVLYAPRPPELGGIPAPPHRVLSPGEQQTVRTNWTTAAVGTRTVTIGQHPPKRFDVLTEHNPVLVDVDTPAAVVRGERYNVTATLKNNASVELHATVVHRSPGEQTNRSVSVDGGGNRTVTFETVADTAGQRNHTITVHDRTRRGSTEIRAPEAFRVDSVQVPGQPTRGEEFEVRVTVSNTGGRDGAVPVAIKAGDRVLVNETVTVPAGETATVSATRTANSTGSLELRATTPDGERSTTLVVGEQSSAANESSTESTDGSGPGFGIAPGVLAVVAALLIARSAAKAR